ncbi:hypothetical protein T11_17128 [Trichinella zimbabwensis]|uniref:Uncharacterized protein n=1 Tax=Trichinella zimbabwensis TaxID=268475 RepID=A0A0V1HBZ1_9BILA|nr:hypothetical protein T11_17128 [Trichinella zimbabwensis]
MHNCLMQSKVKCNIILLSVKQLINASVNVKNHMSRIVQLVICEVLTILEGKNHNYGSFAQCIALINNLWFHANR